MDTSWCRDIYTSIEDNSSWKTSILFPTSLFSIYNLTGVNISNSDTDHLNFSNNNESMEIETDIEVNMAKAIDTEIEVNIESTSNYVATQSVINDTNNNIGTLSSTEIISMSSQTSSTNHKKFLKPNDKHEVDILLFLNPSLLIQSQINTVSIKHDFPQNTCFLFEGYKGFDDKQKLITSLYFSSYP